MMKEECKLWERRVSVLTLPFFSDLVIVKKKTSLSYSAASPVAGQRGKLLSSQGQYMMERWWNDD
jgi:hypothetical protein